MVKLKLNGTSGINVEADQEIFNRLALLMLTSRFVGEEGGPEHGCNYT